MAAIWTVALGNEGAILPVLAEAKRLKAIADELSTIAGLLSPILFAGPLSAVDASADLIETKLGNGENLAASARNIYRARRMRSRIFKDDGLFGEPAWDMMLDLFVAEADNKPLSVTAACIGSAVPSSTALRWLALLEKRGLVERRADQRDARRIFLHLTAKGHGAMTECLRQAGLLAAMQSAFALED